MNTQNPKPLPQTSLAKILAIAGLVIFANIVLLAAIYFLIIGIKSNPNLISPISKLADIRPLDAFTFDSLRQRTYQATPIILEEELAGEEKFISHLFSFTSDGKKVTGQINIPLTPNSRPMPAIVMLRGFVDPSIYQTGMGTSPAAKVFANNGFVTIAPDFLGYGGSDNPENDVFWERLSKPVIVLNLLESLKTLDFIDDQHVFMWAHSNGGQIALSVLEITGRPYPTALWAPVSKGFPYNILFYTDEFDDYGKSLRKELAKFETKYDTDLYSIHKYFDRINAPVLIHQGGADPEVPQTWSNELVDELTKIKDSTTSGEFLDVTYFKYPAANHNLRPDWDTVVIRDLEFFRKHLQTSP